MNAILTMEPVNTIVLILRVATTVPVLMDILLMVITMAVHVS